MAFSDLRFWRLFIFMVLLEALCLAADEQDHNDDHSSSSSVHHELNRTVVLSPASERYLAMIFQDYSDNLTGKISAPRFNDLLHDLGLGEVVVTRGQAKQEPTAEHRRHSWSYEGSPSEFAGQQRRRTRRSEDEFKSKTQHLVSHRNPASSRDRKRRDIVERRDSHDDHEQCLEEHDLLHIHKVNKNEGVSEADFVRICPSLIHQLYEGVCKQPSSEMEERADNKMLHVWGYGVLSITVISLTSLLAIAIIPLMGRSIYKKLMSFLVALAVGTLSGDALLHLIPHAFLSSHADGDTGDRHKMNVYKSCVIMAGIYVFFMVECAMKARLVRRKQGQGNLHLCDDVISPEEMSLSQKKKYAKKYHQMVGSRLAGIQRCISCDGTRFPKVSSPFSESCKPTTFELDSVESGKEERDSNRSDSSQEKEPLWKSGCHKHHCHQRDSMSERSKHSFSDTELVSVLQGKSCIHPNIYTNDNFAASSSSDSDGQTDHNVSQIHCHHGNQYTYPMPSETTTTRGSENGENGDQSYEEEHDHHDHHHHHHHHNHKIDKSTSIATVAWMVIVGDGFHNFSDGLAVGTAFSVSLTSGLTTAIAVFCHELPHELGDFAILLKSGLTFRQAITYNLASAIISYIGLVLGIIIGDIESAHTWVLALTAGMFLYISLVDMLPELSNYIQEGGGWSVVLSQNMGILTGIAIMLVIALYER